MRPALHLCGRLRVTRTRAPLWAGEPLRARGCRAFLSVPVPVCVCVCVRVCLCMCVSSCLTHLHDRQLVIFGGCGADGNPLNDLWIFDLETLCWTQPLIQGATFVEHTLSHSLRCCSCSYIRVPQVKPRRRARITAHRSWVISCSSSVAKRARARSSVVRISGCVHGKTVFVCAVADNLRHRRGDAGHRVALLEPNHTGAHEGGCGIGWACLSHRHSCRRRDSLVRLHVLLILGYVVMFCD